MSFDRTSTSVIRASEPSVLILHDSISIYKLCSEYKRNKDREWRGSESHSHEPWNLSCARMWAESLGTRSSMGKMLFQNASDKYIS